MKKIVLFILLQIVLSQVFSANTLSVFDINPIPAQIMQNSTISTIQYGVHNNSASATYSISFKDLNSKQIDYTSNCTSLAPGADCDINITFTAPSLPSGEDSEPFSQRFFVLGAPNPATKLLQTKIIAASTDVTPSINIGLDTKSVTTTTNSYDVTLTPETGSPIVCNAMVFGASNFCEAIAQGTYDVSVSPASVAGSDTKTYDAPATFEQHITKNGQEVDITYSQNKDITVNTDITAPNYTGGGLSVEAKGDGVDITHSQSAGSHEFDVLAPGQYTVSAPTYVGSDTETYIPQISNPITIDATHTVFTITYAAQPPSTQHVSTDITAPNLSDGKTVAIACSDGAGHDYTHNQPSGTATYDTMVDASYTCTASDYTVNQDTYTAALSNPYLVDATHATIAITYSKAPPPTGFYDWSVSHLESIKDANVAAIIWGGGSTTSPIHISSNPPINPWLNTKIMGYENGTPLTVLTTAQVQGMPAYMAMGTITEPDTGAVIPSPSDQLKSLKMDIGFHYVGNGSGDRGCFVDGVGEGGCTETPYSSTLVYDPLVEKMASQARDVEAVNSHTLVNGVAFYTIDMSDGTDAIVADTTNDTNLTAHFYNIMYEAQLMEAEYTQNSTRMIMFLNPDSVFPFQKCADWYCPVMWRSGISNDTTSKVIAAPNLQADIEAAIDRLVTKGHLTSGEATALKTSLNTSGILTPPPVSKRTEPGLPEIVLAYNWVMKSFAPHVAFGWGMNFYDSANSILNPSGKAQPWQTASADWLHKINHLGYSQSQIDAGVAVDAQMLTNYVKDMNFLGNAAGDYKPDFIYFDKHERDSFPDSTQLEVSAGFAFNGVDWDTYLEYVKDFEADMNHPPVMLWQMPGATIQVEGATFTGVLGSTVGMWAFGIPELHNDFSNWDPTQKSADNNAWTALMDEFYFTQNSNINDLEGYLKMAAGHP